MKDDLSQEIHGNMIFSLYAYKCYKYDITILHKKNGQKQNTYFKEEAFLQVLPSK